MSPIETQFLAAIRAQGVFVIEGASLDDWSRNHIDRVVEDCACTFVAVHDFLVCGYRIDVLLSVVGDGGLVDARIAIECDGHDWHERTQQQASYDRARDRELLAKEELVTIRFTGREIHRDANQCARESLDCLRAIVQQHARVASVTTYPRLSGLLGAIC